MSLLCVFLWRWRTRQHPVDDSNGMLRLHLKGVCYLYFELAIQTSFFNWSKIPWFRIIKLIDALQTCKELKRNVFQLSWLFFYVQKSALPKCVAQCATAHAFHLKNRGQLREWDWIPLRKGFSHSPKRGNNLVPLPPKTSQLVITYKWERSAFECIWDWAAGSYHRGALAPRHKWMERAQCNGRLNRGALWTGEREREETVAWDKGGWILG